VNEIHVEIEITLKSKMRRRRVDDATQAKNLINVAHRANITEISQNNERKKKIIAQEKKIEFRQIFKSFIDSSTEFWRLIVWAKNRNHKSKEIFKISTLTKKNAIEIDLITIENFAFKTKMLHRHCFSKTTKMNLFDLQTFVYRSIIEKTKTRI
jgi:hypothetical protein